jgi:uncharacterized membrane protein
VARSFKQYFLDVVYPHALVWGHYTRCHQLDSRSFHVGIRKYPVCARCTGIFLAVPVALAACAIWGPLPLLVSIAIALPMVIDGMVQAVSSYESTNAKRFMTGSLFGIAFGSITASIARAVF